MPVRRSTAALVAGAVSAVAALAPAAAQAVVVPPDQYTVSEIAIPTALTAPTDIVRGPDGAVWFTQIAGKVARIGLDRTVTEFDLPSSDSGPLGITAGQDGAVWFTEYFEQRIGRITTGGAVTEWDLPGDGGPYKITIGPGGTVWVSVLGDSNGVDLYKMTPDGTFTPEPTARPGVDGGAAWGVTSSLGAIWFTAPAGSTGAPDQVGRLDADGTITRHALQGPNGAPTNIAAATDGAVWFVESDADEVGRIAPDGTVTEIPLPPHFPRTWETSNYPRSLAADGSGGMWVIEESADYLDHIASDGTIREYALGGVLGRTAQSVAVGSDGAVYFTQGGRDTIGVLDDRSDGVPATLSPATRSFGSRDVSRGPGGAITFTVRNRGTANLVLGAASIDGANAGDFRVLADDDDCSGTTLAAGASCSLMLVFDPTSNGARTATLTVPGTSRDPLRATLTGTGTYTYLGTAAPTTRDFGVRDATVGPSPARTVSVRNRGTGPLEIGQAAISGPHADEFALAAGLDGCSGTTLAAGATCTIGVTFDPSVPTTRTAQLDVPSNASEPISAGLTGVGSLTYRGQITPGSRNFGNRVVTAGPTAASVFTVRNRGTGELYLGQSIEITGPDASAFTVVPGEDTCSGQTLALDASCTVAVVFNPSRAGAHEASLGASASVPVALTGTGV